MANRLSQALGPLTNRIFAVAGFLSALAGLAVPAVRDFAISHPLWGWGLFLAAVIVLPSITNAPTVDKKAVVRARDLELLRERSEGWELDSWFFRYLTQAATHEHLSLEFVSNLENHLERWEFDARDVKDPELQRIWKACEKAALHYNAMLNEYTFMKRSAQDYLEVPREWEQIDPDRYQAAFQELPAAQGRLLTTIRDVHRVLHEG